MIAPPQTLIEARKRAVEFLEGVTPAVLGSPASWLVAQGRPEHNPTYSSCADLAHAMYEALGLKHRQINRDDPETIINEWRSGVNVARLASWPGVWHVAPTTPEEWQTVDGGDVLIRWARPDTRDAHVVCVIANHGSTLSTAEYGQARPGIGRLFERRIWGHEGRPWQRWLPLSYVLHACGVGRG